MAGRFRRGLNLPSSRAKSEIMSTRAASAPSPAPSDSLADGVAALVAGGKLPVPMLPQVAAEVVQAASDRNADAVRLSALIHRDPALAGQVLRIANSPLYAPRMPIVSLQQAVARLGLSALTEIALAASVESGVFRVRGWEEELRALWQASLATAAFAKEIARLRRLNVETAFLCGLLHDVGRPVILQVTVDEAGRRKLANTTAAVRAQIWALVEQHGPAARSRVVEVWRLPAAVIAGVTHQDAPAAAGPHGREAAITAAARRLAGRMLAPGREPETPLHEHPACALLNLYREDVEALLARTDEVRKLVDSLTG
jgi:HD-like signal output (HDOD) protein